MRVGVVRNPMSHANIGRSEPDTADASTTDAVLLVEPATPEALEQDLQAFAQCGVKMLVIDGGDGTIRDVLSRAATIFGDAMPLIALIPSGKTNVLAIDLGVPRDWTLAKALAAAKSDQAVIKHRAPLEVRWDDGRPSLRGFVFGLGAFVRATSLAQTVHKTGRLPQHRGGDERAGRPGRHGDGRQARPVAGRRAAVPGHRRRGDPHGRPLHGAGHHAQAPAVRGQAVRSAARGDEVPGRRCAAAPSAGRLPALLAGKESAWSGRHGYRRGDASRLRITTEQPLVVDGDVYDGAGGVTVVLAPPLRFLAA